MTLTDTVQLATTTVDGYGDKTATVLTDVKSLFIQRTGVVHTDNADGITSDAAVYLDPQNEILLANMYRLEGMYIIAKPFGQSTGESWYKISNVTVAQRKLLDNAIDNIYCRLEKVAGLAYVSYIS
jgi:hypothetical protein